MDKKIIAMMIVGAIVIGGGSFYAGTTFPLGGNATGLLRGQVGQFRGGQNGTGGMQDRQGLGGVTIGEIIAKDATSITVKLALGGSKIVFFTDKTTVAKNVAGSIADLVVSENVVVNGSVNSDGSVSAQNIQLGSGMQMFGRPSPGTN